jgi:cyanamide hydratase
MPKQHIEEFGWPAVPRNRTNVPSADHAKTHAVTVNLGNIWPNTEVVKKAQEYAKKGLSKETYNHSLRVYCYGTYDTPAQQEQFHSYHPSTTD